MNCVKAASAARAGDRPQVITITAAMSTRRIMPRSPRQLLVLHAMRNDAVLAEPAHLVLLVVLEVALEPFDMAVAFEGQDVGRDAVEEPAIMADDDGAAGEILQSLFERAQRVDVEVVGRFVEQQHVGTGLQHLGEMDAVAFTARERADLLLLIGALEVERRAIAARVDFLLAEQDQLVAAGDLLPHVLATVERVARLVDIAEMHGLADRDGAL